MRCINGFSSVMHDTAGREVRITEYCLNLKLARCHSISSKDGFSLFSLDILKSLDTLQTFRYFLLL